MRKPTILRHSLFIDFSNRFQDLPLRARFYIVFGMTVFAAACTLAVGRIPQSLAYHQFADQRNFLGIPNCLNVLTNLPFVLIGITALKALLNSFATGIHFMNYLAVFTGIFLTGFGSAYYHLHPENASLLFDRLPMVIVFMGFLTLTIAECIREKTAKIIFPFLIFFGIASVLLWYYTELKGKGDLRMYGFAQFYTIYIIPLIAWLFPSPLFNKGVSSLLWINITYAIAKCCEHFDKEIYALTHIISGHSLKHIAASLSALFILKMFEKKFSI